MPNCTNCGTWNPEDKTLLALPNGITQAGTPQEKTPKFSRIPDLDVGLADRLFCGNYV